MSKISTSEELRIIEFTKVALSKQYPNSDTDLYIKGRRLDELFNHENQIIRELVLKSLTELKIAAFKKEALSLLQDKDSHVRCSAIIYLTHTFEIDEQLINSLQVLKSDLISKVANCATREICLRVPVALQKRLNLVLPEIALGSRSCGLTETFSISPNWQYLATFHGEEYSMAGLTIGSCYLFPRIPGETGPYIFKLLKCSSTQIWSNDSKYFATTTIEFQNDEMGHSNTAARICVLKIENDKCYLLRSKQTYPPSTTLQILDSYSVIATSGETSNESVRISIQDFLADD